MMLKVYEAFGVLQGDNLSLATLTENVFEDKPTVYILSYTLDQLNNDEKKSINELKETMYNYLYTQSDSKPIRTSERALEKMLNN